jgi:archaellum component FlaC
MKHDELQIKHAIDMVEMHLSTLKDAALSVDDSDYDELEDELSSVKEDLEKEEEKVTELEGDIKNIKREVSAVIRDLQDYADELERDHPGYSVDDLRSAIGQLENI